MMGFLSLCYLSLVVWTKVSAAAKFSDTAGNLGGESKRCNESPSVQPGPNRDEEKLSCCSGWILLDGKCVRVFQASKTECNSAVCPWGRVCSPFGGNNCVCPRGRRGTLCKEYCKKGNYGWGCRQTCSCRHGGECHPVTGSCDFDRENGEDYEEVSTTMTNRASNNTAGFCGSGCGLKGTIGCICNEETDSCECPGYVVALLVVSILTWVSIGSMFAGYYIKRNGFVQPLLDRYRRKTDGYGEDINDSGFNTDVENVTTVIPWCDYPPPISQRASGEYPLLAPLSVPHLFELSSYVTRISRSSVPRSTSHSSEEDEGEDDDDDDTDDHDYLNVPEIRREADSDGEEYSQPYEHLDQLSRQGSVHSQYATRTDSCEPPPRFIMRTWTETEQRYLNQENSYVNDSVLKWKRRFATRRTFLTRNHQRRMAGVRCPVAPLSSSCSDVRAIAPAVKKTQEKERSNRKPTLKPKPEFIKLKMLMDIEKRKRGFGRTRAVKSCDVFHSTEDDVSLTQMNSIEDAEDTSDVAECERTRNKRIRHLRAALLKKGISVPDSISNQDREKLLVPTKEKHLHPNGQYDPIYENESVVKPAATRHSRLNSAHIR